MELIIIIIVYFQPVESEMYEIMTCFTVFEPKKGPIVGNMTVYRKYLDLLDVKDPELCSLQWERNVTRSHGIQDLMELAGTNTYVNVSYADQVARGGCTTIKRDCWNIF